MTVVQLRDALKDYAEGATVVILPSTFEKVDEVCGVGLAMVNETDSVICLVGSAQAESTP